ncbi:DUF1232 domain-containing protein [Erythrobacter gaetbuli]|uniref:DUF1232 domain-containing protein n=1 Tax=Qipengyuania gaetbuli TaxID=266952 RepID=A0A844Y3R3_9SPHN|nr:DUF1232 domain-containing protein [Qipengyuania gaetbuli]
MPSLRDWAKALKRDTLALWLAARDHRTPLAAKLLAGGVAAYALSPIDLIPDFIPVLGLLDDLLVVPIGIWLVLKLIPAPLMEELRERAGKLAERPNSMVGLLLVLTIWFALAAAAGLYLIREV